MNMPAGITAAAAIRVAHEVDFIREREAKVLRAYEDYRESIGRPRKGPEDLKQSIIFAAFRSAYGVGYLDGLLDGAGVRPDPEEEDLQGDDGADLL